MTEISSVLAIQSDWNDASRDNDTALWILHKHLGEKANYGKIGGYQYDEMNDSFQENSRTTRTISITHQPSGMTTLFVAPAAVFENIHTKRVLSIDVAEGGLGVSVTMDNTIYVWESFRGEVRRRLEGHMFDVYSCRLFPSGTVILSAGGDMQLRIWDAASGVCPVILKGHTSAILDTAIIERGKNVISVSRDGTARLWNCGTAECISVLFSSASPINSCAITHVGNEVSLPPPEEAASEIESDTHGKVLLVGCDDGMVHLIAVESRKVLGSFSMGSSVNAVCWVSETVGVAGMMDGRLTCIDVKSGTTAPFVHSSASDVQCLHPLNQGFLVGRHDGLCQYYKLDGTNPCQLTGSDCDPIYSCASDDTHVYTAARDGKIRKYNIRDMQLTI